MHDAIFTAMHNVVTPLVELAVISITGSSGQGTNSAVRNPDRRISIGITENTPIKSAFSWLHLNIDQNTINKTPDIEIPEDVDFLA